MSTLVQTHVYKFSSLLHSLESSLQNSLGRTYESNHRTVGSLARIHVQNLYALLSAIHVNLDCSNGCHYLVYHFTVAPFAEIGHTFNYPFHMI